VRWRTSTSGDRGHSVFIVTKEAVMSNELQQIRSELRNARIVMSLTISALIAYAAGCAGLCVLQLGQF
jgi:hypothetical protein